MHALVELTHWTVEQIEATPAIALDRLLLVQSAKQRALASLTEGN